MPDISALPLSYIKPKPDGGIRTHDLSIFKVVTDNAPTRTEFCRLDMLRGREVSFDTICNMIGNPLPLRPNLTSVKER